MSTDDLAARRAQLVERIVAKAREVIRLSPTPTRWPNGWGVETCVPVEWENAAVVLEIWLDDLTLLEASDA